VAQAWTDLPLDRPITIDGPSASALGLSIEPLPADAPAIITYTVAPQSRPAQVVGALLAELDQIARELFPAWLPAAAPIDSPAGSGAVAVRSVALRVAHSEGQYGPFLADLAERALHGRAGHGQAEPSRRFDPEVRAAGLAKVIAASFSRERTAILVRLTEPMPPEDEESLVTAARWLTDSGGFGVWFTGVALRSADDVEAIRFNPPTPDALLAEEPPDVDGPALPGSVGYPAIAGRPHPASEAEQLLETALEGADWAVGREWNQLYQAHPLTNPVRLDLLWRSERCVVEIDGAEHRQPTIFGADRQRDVLLQLAGYAVLRFTNSQVIQHRDLVLTQIREFLAGRRTENRERVIHA
jgi:very-short-patch-repair endonuclease